MNWLTAVEPSTGKNWPGVSRICSVAGEIIMFLYFKFQVLGSRVKESFDLSIFDVTSSII